ncbi:MAG: OsmC family protein [Myxococcota bacterium]
MEMKVSFPDNLKVDAELNGFHVRTDQPRSIGGDETQPSPTELFFASIATCAGIFMLWFMKERDIDPEGSGITMKMEKDPDTKMVGRLVLDLRLPAGFPEKYEQAIIRVVDQCTVKRYLKAPPSFDVRTSR